MHEPEFTVVCDAGPIIHLDELGCVGLLADHPRVLVPDAVWVEAERHRPGFGRNLEVRWERVRGRRPFPVELESLSIAMGLHLGETEAPMIALEHRDSVLLSDDTGARLAASSLGFKVHGTIGILIRAIRRGRMNRESVVAVLREIPKRSTLHLSDHLLQEVILRVEREGRR